MRPIQRIPLSATQELDCMQFNPFEGDFGEPGDRIFSDRICLARKPAECDYCGQEIVPGEQQRRQVALYDGHRMRTYRWCYPCCTAMAASWWDGGKEIEERFALRRETHAA